MKFTGIMLHPQIGSEGTEFRSDCFHSSMEYIFDSLWKSKDKEIFYHATHIHIARIFLEGFLRLHFFVAWTDRKPFKEVRDIMLHPQIGSEGTEFRSDFFLLSHKYIFVQLDQVKILKINLVKGQQRR